MPLVDVCVAGRVIAVLVPVVWTSAVLGCLLQCTVRQSRWFSSCLFSLGCKPLLVVYRSRFCLNCSLVCRSGSIPTAWSGFASLSILLLDNNSLQGTLPRLYPDLPVLRQLRTCGNRLSGDSPTHLSTLPRLLIPEITLGSCNTSLSLCVAGYFCNNASLSLVANPCSIGKFSLAGSSDCTNCTAPAGYRCPSASPNTTGVPCPAGFYSPGGAADCYPCNVAPGYQCSAGSASPVGTPCPVGKFSPGGRRYVCACIRAVCSPSMCLSSWSTSLYRPRLLSFGSSKLAPSHTAGGVPWFFVWYLAHPQKTKKTRNLLPKNTQQFRPTPFLLHTYLAVHAQAVRLAPTGRHSLFLIPAAVDSATPGDTGLNSV
jgi:hypothetical protein